ncbi:MAG TPA: hypothetical protein PLV68_04100 [Ilumatobacteraceae bacterium]|nr:hypothetical protein [Ilumatobacteraceae bacterium]
MKAADLSAVLAINAINAADVDDLTPADMEILFSASTIALAAIDASTGVVGFCVVTDPTCPHRTPRSDWAFDRGADLHLERVAFDMRFSGLGLGLELFTTLDDRIADFVMARPEHEVSPVTLTSIVRSEPPNEHAVRFHASRGFGEVDQRRWDGITYSLMSRSFSDRRTGSF